MIHMHNNTCDYVTHMQLCDTHRDVRVCHVHSRNPYHLVTAIAPNKQLKKKER